MPLCDFENFDLMVCQVAELLSRNISELHITVQVRST